MPKLAFVGANHPHRYWWAEAIRRIEGAKLVAISDPVAAMAEALAGELGVAVRPRQAILDDDEIDFVIVCGKNYENWRYALELIEHDKPFLLEKPGASRLSELKSLLQAADGRRARAHLGYILRYSPSVAWAQDLLIQNALGTITLARFHVSMPAQAWREDIAGWFLDSDNQEGPFEEDACHPMDIILHWWGMPLEVTAQWANFDLAPNKGEDALVAILRYPTHLVVIHFTAWEAFHSAWDSAPPLPGLPWGATWEFEIYGTVATARAGLNPAWQEMYVAPGRAGPPGWQRLSPPRPAGQDELQAALKRGFYDYAEAALREALAVAAGDRASPMGLAHAYNVMLALKAVYRSCRLQRPVPVEDVSAPALSRDETT